MAVAEVESLSVLTAAPSEGVVAAEAATEAATEDVADVDVLEATEVGLEAVETEVEADCFFLF